jgi:hypothetical protein
MQTTTAITDRAPMSFCSASLWTGFSRRKPPPIVQNRIKRRVAYLYGRLIQHAYMLRAHSPRRNLQHSKIPTDPVIPQQCEIYTTLPARDDGTNEILAMLSGDNADR